MKRSELLFTLAGLLIGIFSVVFFASPASAPPPLTYVER